MWGDGVLTRVALVLLCIGSASMREPAAGTESNVEVLASGALGWGTRTHSFIQQSGVEVSVGAKTWTRFC